MLPLTTVACSRTITSTRFMFYENWRSKQDLDEHLAMPYLAPLRERGQELLAADVEIRFYTMLSPYR